MLFNEVSAIASFISPACMHVHVSLCLHALPHETPPAGRSATERAESGWSTASNYELTYNVPCVLEIILSISDEEFELATAHVATSFRSDDPADRRPNS